MDSFGPTEEELAGQPGSLFLRCKCQHVVQWSRTLLSANRTDPGQQQSEKTQNAFHHVIAPSNSRVREFVPAAVIPDRDQLIVLVADTVVPLIVPSDGVTSSVTMSPTLMVCSDKINVSVKLLVAEFVFRTFAPILQT